MKLLRLDLASLATQGVCAGAQPNAYTGYGIVVVERAILWSCLMPCGYARCREAIWKLSTKTQRVLIVNHGACFENIENFAILRWQLWYRIVRVIKNRIFGTISP